MTLCFTKNKVGKDAYLVSKTWRLGFHAFRTEHFLIFRLCYLRDKRGTHYMEITKQRRCFDTFGTPKENNANFCPSCGAKMKGGND